MTFQNVQIIGQLKRKKWIFIIVLLFILFAFTRFWNLEGRTIFGWDQERDAFQIYDLLVNKKLFLIGPRVLSDTGFFLAPYYTYLLAPFYAITRLDPFSIVIFITIVQSVFFVASYFIFNRIFGRSIALLTLFLYMINPLMIRYDTIAWNPIFIPMVTAIVYGIWYVVYSIKKHNIIIVILLGILNGLAFHFHVQGAFLFIQTIVFLLLIYKKAGQKLKNIGLVILGFVSTFLPIVLFDIRHDFLNFKLILNIFSSSGGVDKGIFSFLPVLNNFISWQGIPFLRYEWLTFIIYIISIWLIFLLAKKQKGYLKYFNMSYAVLMLTVIIGLMIYGKRPSEYYFNMLIVGGLVIISQALISLHNRVNNNWLLAILIAGVLLIQTRNYSSLFKSDEVQGLRAKKEVIAYAIKKVGICDITLHKEITLGFDTGFSYLMDVKKPKTDNQCKKIVRIAYPPKDSDDIVGKYGVEVINSKL